MRYLLLPLLLPGCAAVVQVGPAAQDDDPQWLGEGEPPGNEVRITRPSEAGLITTVATRPTIRLDGREVGRCQVGKPIVLRLPDGSYAISAETAAGRATQWVTVSDFAQVDITCGVEGVVSPKPSLTLN